MRCPDIAFIEAETTRAAMTDCLVALARRVEWDADDAGNEPPPPCFPTGGGGAIFARHQRRGPLHHLVGRGKQLVDESAGVAPESCPRLHPHTPPLCPLVLLREL